MSTKMGRDHPQSINLSIMKTDNSGSKKTDGDSFTATSTPKNAAGVP